MASKLEMEACNPSGAACHTMFLVSLRNWHLHFPNRSWGGGDEAGHEGTKIDWSSVAHGILLSTNLQLNVNDRKLVRRS